MWRTLWTIGGALGAVLFLAGVPLAAEPKAQVFEMEEFSLLDQGDSPELQSTNIALTGRYQPCGSMPQSEVKKYPELKSSRPLYGSVYFGQIPTDRNSGIRFFYVLDESESKVEQTAKKDASILDTLAGALSGTPDRSGTKRTYDRLYFDANGDLDLTNDPVIKPMADPPTSRTSSQEIVFDVLSVPVNEDAGLGIGPLKVLPRLRLQSATRTYMSFATTTARKGTVELEGKKYTALLTQPAVITGRFDGPLTSLILIPTEDSARSGGLMSQQYLSAMRWVQGEFFEVSATPKGDQLTIGPYSGDAGLLKVDPGDRQDPGKVGVSGSLRSKETSLRIGDLSSMSQADKLPQHRIPVGDYLPLSLSVDLGTLNASFSQNYYSMKEPYARLPEVPTGSVKIRKDQPFVLDFSGKPNVMFISPAKDQTFTPGTTIKIRARMIDPKLNLLIRGLSDTTKITSERTYMISGRTVKIPRYASIAPTVTITDSKGKQVAEGTMPFG